MEAESQPLMELEPPTHKNSDRPRNRHRRRRRSSARFLRLTGRLMEDIDEDEEEEEVVESEQHLGDMYKKAIRMNAENRINASNSWNLRLIENIDKFLEEDPVETDSPASSRSASPELGDENSDPNQTTTGRGKQRKNGGKQEKRVNFTKASCTLDASVKIYSYRVDDVHLTSYKVLANLNRTDNTKEKQSKETNAASQSQGADDDNAEEVADPEDEAPNKATSGGSTLETNKANINMNKLDSAFDIDPLFHKMSKTFDEGGAKGLLLVNLGVGDKGCNIVFDSKAEYEEESNKSDSNESNDDEEEKELREEGMVDISLLKSKLDSTCGLESVEALELVPQLATLREQHAELKAGGFVDELVRASRRYASSQEEEKEADMSIHQEAIERSRVSQGDLGRSYMSTQDDDGGFGFGDDDDDGGANFAADDYGGGDDNDDDAGFDDFIALDTIAPRFSSISFQESSYASGHPNNTHQTQADVLLDAICSGNVLGGGNYEYFDTQALSTSIAGNLWAGSAHWKRSEPMRHQNEKKEKKKPTTKAPKKKKGKGQTLVDLAAKPVLEDILRKPPKKKGGASPLQISKAMLTKYTKEENLLPPDSGIGVEKLASLFLRPNAIVQSRTEKTLGGVVKGKSVCFGAAVETFGEPFAGGADDSFGGDDDDGPGFAFADNDDDDDVNSNDGFVVEELKGVRKVDTKQVAVGYATVAKKVDVRKLKRDLWSGIESVLVSPVEEEEKKDEEVTSDTEDSEDAPMKSPRQNSEDGLSFQKTVRDMELSKTQMDVTLPFYFICVLHLANEKELRLDSQGLEDFVIHGDADGPATSV